MGPLAGLQFIELAGIGPAPFAAMVLADLGATGVRIESPRPALALGDPALDITRRGRQAICLDLRQDDDRERLLALAAQSDLLIEGFRPGVIEKLGIGPDALLARNPRIVIGRVTGWGQDGPWAQRAGHDLDYIAVAGLLAHIGRGGAPPTPPLNLVGDYGSGAMLLLVGVLAALWEAQRSGRGQVVDAAMVDGAAVQMALFQSLHAQGLWSLEAGVNLLDSGAPFYDVYRTKDDRWLAVACLEPQFFALFVDGLGLDASWKPRQFEVGAWDLLRSLIAERIRERSMSEWSEVFGEGDACVAPVLTMAEAPEHPHLRARGTYVESGGFVQPSPAPRFSRTPSGPPGAIPPPATLAP